MDPFFNHVSDTYLLIYLMIQYLYMLRKNISYLTDNNHDYFYRILNNMPFARRTVNINERIDMNAIDASSPNQSSRQRECESHVNC